MRGREREAETDPCTRKAEQSDCRFECSLLHFFKSRLSSIKFADLPPSHV